MLQYFLNSSCKVCLFSSFLALQNFSWFFLLIEVSSPFVIQGLSFLFWYALESGERGVSKSVSIIWRNFLKEWLTFFCNTESISQYKFLRSFRKYFLSSLVKFFSYITVLVIEIGPGGQRCVWCFLQSDYQMSLLRR